MHSDATLDGYSLLESYTICLLLGNDVIKSLHGMLGLILPNQLQPICTKAGSALSRLNANGVLDERESARYDVIGSFPFIFNLTRVDTW